MEMFILMFFVAPVYLGWLWITGQLRKYLPPPKDE